MSLEARIVILETKLAKEKLKTARLEEGLKVGRQNSESTFRTAKELHLKTFARDAWQCFNNLLQGQAWDGSNWSTLGLTEPQIAMLKKCADGYTPHKIHEHRVVKRLHNKGLLLKNSKGGYTCAASEDGIEALRTLEQRKPRNVKL